MKKDVILSEASVVIISSSSLMSADILKFVRQYSVYTGCFTFVTGVIGNALNILVFTQLKLFRDNRCAFYLTVESIFNFIHQFFFISLTILTSIYGDDATDRSLIWCKFRYILAPTFALTTYYMICFVAVDQFFSTSYRFNLRQICTLKLARCLTYTVVCIWIVHNIVFSFFLNIQTSFGCVISNYIWRQYSTFFFYPVLAGLLPIVVSSLFSILAFRNVRHIIRRQLSIVRRRLDRQMTAIVLMRVIIFVSLASPYTIYRIYAINFPISRNESMAYAIERLIQAISFSLISLNYTISFYAFVIISSRFRRQVKLILVKKYWQRWKYWCCLKNNQISPENAESFSANIELEENI